MRTGQSVCGMEELVRNIAAAGRAWDDVLPAAVFGSGERKSLVMAKYPFTF